MNDNAEKTHSKLNRITIKKYKNLYFKFHGRLVLFANKFTGDIQVSRDLVQDAFLKLWEKQNSKTSIESPKAYLFQTVRNSCLNHQRHIKIKHSVEENLIRKINSTEKSVYYELGNPFQSLLELELEEIIGELVNSMPDKCRQVYKMSRHDFLKNKQIAKKLDISVKAVEKHISKALLILRFGLSNYLMVLMLFSLTNL